MPVELGSTQTNTNLGTFTLPTMEELVARYGQDTAAGTAQLLGSGTSPINIRELDPWTGQKHYEYQIPGGQQSFQPNLWQYGLNNQWKFTGPGPTPESGPPNVAVPRDPTGGLNLSNYDPDANRWNTQQVSGPAGGGGTGGTGGTGGGGVGGGGGGGGGAWTGFTPQGTNRDNTLVPGAQGGGGNSGNNSLTDLFPRWYGTVANNPRQIEYPTPEFKTSPYKGFTPSRSPYDFFPYARP